LRAIVPVLLAAGLVVGVAVGIFVRQVQETYVTHTVVVSETKTATITQTEIETETTTEYRLLWMQPTVSGFDNFGTATYKDGVLYAPSKRDDSVYAINATNGDIIWRAKVRWCDASPCIDGDVIYVGELVYGYGSSPKAMALNRTTGEEIWHFEEPNHCGWAGSPLVHDDYLFYATYLDSSHLPGIYALNKTNGDLLWHQNIGIVVGSVAYDNGMVFVSAWVSPGQYAFNATTGEEIWRVNYGGSWDSSPVIYEGMIIQVAQRRKTILVQPYFIDVYSTHVLDETNGELIRKFDDKGSKSTPLVHNGKIFIPDNDDYRMWAFDLTTGEELWRTVELHDGSFQNFSYCSPAGAGGAIYYQSLNGTFYVINEADGSIFWSYALGGLGFGSPSIGDGCVFITNDAGLYAFKIDPGLGSHEWPMFCQNNLHISYWEQDVESRH